MHISCDDGSTNVKLAWYEDDELKTVISPNSFRNGWKVSGMGKNRTFNYTVDEIEYTFDDTHHKAIKTTNIEYQYSDANLLAVHHALLNSGVEPQPIKLTATLPLSEFYNHNCQKNTANIERKIANLLRPISLNNGACFEITDVDVMPESLPAAMSILVKEKVGRYEKSLIIDLGGTTLDGAVVVGQFDDITVIHGNSDIGMTLVTQTTLSALQVARSDVSAFIANQIIEQRHDRDFLAQMINDHSKIDYVVETIEGAISQLQSRVINDLSPYRDVNRVFLLGGGGKVIESPVRTSWKLSPEKIMLLEDPQKALVREIAKFKKGA
ncbi:plasmid segregation protein ParM domain-containing protein (plasmid) [Xenorhabdus stockiae]|uniref:plasmid segregation protein ParM domain-containing protein n=1 Tax=Xenorhabdus stockiae TaxID=351614 RepID=UPI003CEEA61E